jgi:hypothetical protein
VHVFQGHKARVTGLAFSPDGALLTSVANNGTLALWDSAGGEGVPLAHVTLYPYGWMQRLAFSPDGRYLAARFPGAGVQVFDTQTRTLVKKLLRYSGLGYEQTLAFSPHGDQLVANQLTVDRGDVLLRWDVRTWEELPPGPALASDAGPGASGHVAFDPSGRRLATGYGSIFDTTTWDEVGDLAFHPPPLRLAWSPDGRLLATGGASSKVEVWDAASGEIVRTIRQSRKFFTDFAFTPDGRHLLTVCNEATAQAWDVGTWQARETLDWQVGKLRALAVSPDGMRAAAGAEKGKIVIWDLD